MVSYMQTTYDLFKSLFINRPWQSKNTIGQKQLDFSTFTLISKLPYSQEYREYEFIPTIHRTDLPPHDALYFRAEIGCADDIVYQTSKEFNSVLIRTTEYKALGFRERLQSAMMSVARNPLSATAKHIIFTNNVLGTKHGNPIIGIFENTHPNANSNVTIEYEIYNTVKGN